MDLADAFAGRLRPRRVLRLLSRLPDTSALAASMAADPPKGGGAPPAWRQMQGWGQDRHLLADLWDLTAAAAMAGAKGKKPPRYPRPQSRAGKVPLSRLIPRRPTPGR